MKKIFFVSLVLGIGWYTFRHKHLSIKAISQAFSQTGSKKSGGTAGAAQPTNSGAAKPAPGKFGSSSPQAAVDGEPQVLLRPNEIDPSLKMIASEGFVYDPTGRRDPFKSFFKVIVVETGPKAVGTQPEFIPDWLKPQPLSLVENTIEGFETTALKLVGIIWDVREPKALIRAPNSKVYMVKKKSKIGKNNGYVATIREGEIVVVEVSSDTKTPTTRIMTLRK